MKKILINENQHIRLFENSIQSIRIYHGTSFDALDDILSDGFISAKKGGQHGETYGMNWFSTKFSTNFSKGVVFSIEISEDEIKQGLFKYMNRSEMTSDREYSMEIPIEGRNLRIEQFGFIKKLDDFDVLKNILEMKKDDVFETIAFIDRINEKHYPNYLPLMTPDNPIFVMLLKQIGRDDLIKENGLV